ncbi:TonB family protein [Teredinibacter turnerae]|uniref:energy transducer TonB n=1 Tax=Teredinibacter turnerae TaxID=2426 RepID=UPI0030D06689
MNTIFTTNHAVFSANQFVRAVATTGLAALVTLALLVLMERLIHMADSPIDDAPPFNPPNVTWEEPKLFTVIKKDLPKPLEVQEAPPMPEPADDTHLNVNLTLPIKPTAIRSTTGPIEVAFGAGFPIPQYQPQPVYPARALRNATEGYVDVIFDVTALGTTENIRILESMPHGMFENAALAAVARWKYQPKTVDGQPVAFPGLSSRLTFVMKD